MYKLYSVVRITDGAEGAIIGIYTDPSEGYDIDTADADGNAPYGDGGWRTGHADEIAEVLWEPK